MRPPVALAMLLIPAGMSADTDTSRLFRDTVFPALRKECVGCHGEGQTLAKLDLRTREAMLAGGGRGPAIVPGKAAESLLMQAIEGKTAFAMPPGGESKRLSPETIAAFRAWIDGGAPWAAAKKESSWTYSEADVWAFRPLKKVEPPAGAANPIDAFLLAKLREKGLEPAPMADRRTLIRRVTFDLTGLPPTPDEVDAFVQDRSEDAWPKLVERLLASPRYGERWGGHWLDVTRYADSSGYSNDFERPNVWRYRDYVIRSFNADKPYDQFVREQIAGDELYPANADAILATGFLRAGPWEHTSMSVEAVTRQMWLDDVTAAVGTTFLGLTTGCARCHDHKFDPIPTKDYYQLQAIFASTEFARPKVPFLNSENAAGAERETARLRQSIERTQARIDGYRRLAAERSAQRGGSTPSDPVAAMQSMKELTPEEFEEFKLHQKHLQVYREALTRFDPLAFAVSSGPLDGATDGGPALKYPKAADYKPAEVRILVGGNLQSPAESVEPGFLSAVAHYAKFAPERVPTSIAGRRSALAAWITDPRNPLPARVMVNRIWQYHFGAALTPDANNLGKTGGKPSHPELLDWLAQRFISDGWSVKSVHRMILLSDAYRRSSSHPTMKQVRTADPSNALLAYFPSRRIDADELRDSILFVAGELSPDAGGPGGYPQINDDVARQPRHAMGSLQPAYHASPEKRIRNRRAIYSFRQRGLMDPFLEVFNEPNPDISCPRRESSTVPTQAFALMNSQFAHDMALAFAARVAKAGGDRERQVRGLFGLAYGRDPSEAELHDALAHWDRMTAVHQSGPPPSKVAPKPIVHMITSELTGEQFQFRQDDSPKDFEPNLHPSDVSPELRALADIALGLLNSNEFVYVY